MPLCDVEAIEIRAAGVSYTPANGSIAFPAIVMSQSAVPGITASRNTTIEYRIPCMMRESEDLHEDLARDLYLFFELYCQRCHAAWAPPDSDRDFGVQGEEWAERFSTEFARLARDVGWGSFEGDVLCPACVSQRSMTRTP
jgi:hypothetical protein